MRTLIYATRARNLLFSYKNPFCFNGLQNSLYKMKRIFRVFAAIYFVLQLATEVQTQLPPNCPLCDVRRCENATLVQQSCPDADLVRDVCGCCRICGSRFGEPCGGAYAYIGTCEYDLKCTVEPSVYLNGANISGTCTRKVCTKNCTKKAERRVCGNDGMWYRNICALRQNKFCRGTGVSEADSRRVCDRACHLLSAPAHGNITFSKGIAQTSVANITCQPPYILREGDQYRTCVEGPRTSGWTGSQPVCRHPCEVPEMHMCDYPEMCVLDENNATTQCVCGSCTEVNEWVCATDEKSYRSRCHVRLTACRNSTPNLVTSYVGKCITDQSPRKRKR